MNAKLKTLALSVLLTAAGAMAQERPQQNAPSGGHEPPPHAYDDCKGRKAGDVVQHATREGKVAATCAESPKGLVARPQRRPGDQPAQAQPIQAAPPTTPGPQTRADANR